MAEQAVGLVVAGAGARGAYEAGALSVLVPALARHGQRPTVFVGTSAGALNVLLFASLSHLDPDEAAEQALGMWRAVRWSDVVRPLARSTLRNTVRYLGQLLHLPGVQVSSLLDPAPLGRTIAAWKHWDDLHRNVQEGRVASIAMVATSFTTNQTTVFLEQHPRRPVPERDDGRGVDYLPVKLASSHVLASASIPAIFPAMHVADAGPTGNWYADGGVRLNAPIKPAVALGADRVVIVATDPLEGVPVDQGRTAPDLYDAVAQVLHAAMVDRMAEDVRTLDKVNRLVSAGLQRGVAKSRGGRPYRLIPRIYVGPTRPGIIAAIAEEVLSRRRRGEQPALDVDLVLLRTALGGARSHGELLSYLLFDPVFVERLIELGRHDAERLLETSDLRNLWR
jgi:NTE family protein